MENQNKKLCPFAAAQPGQEDSVCLGEDCACYVKVHKPRCIGNLVDDLNILTYSGCGLVNVIPWNLTPKATKVKVKRNQQAMPELEAS